MLHYYKPDIDGGDTFTKQIIEKHIIEKCLRCELELRDVYTYTSDQQRKAAILKIFHEITSLLLTFK